MFFRTVNIYLVFFYAYVALLRVTLPPRKSSKKILVSGFFPEAKVVPGENWCWHDQAGEIIV